MEQYENILVIILKHIGDVLVATPVLTALKTAHPTSRLSVLVNKGTEEMVTLNPLVDDVILLDRKRGTKWGDRFWAQLAFLSVLRKKGFDLVLELSGGDRGAILGRVTGAKHRIGFAPDKPKAFGRQHLLSRLVSLSPTTQHMVDYNLALVRSLGIEPSDKKLTIAWSTQDSLHVEALLIHRGWEPGQPFVVLHPTSRWLFKAWHAEGYAQLCDHIEQVHGISVVITSGPEEKERALVNEVLGLTGSHPIDLSGKLTLKQLASCIAMADLFIGVDSAPMHISAAVDTPAIALFGPSGDHMWGPWGDGHTVIKKGWDCQPCGKDGCNGSKVSQCLEAIGAEDVIPFVDEKLGNRQARRSP